MFCLATITITVAHKICQMQTLPVTVRRSIELLGIYFLGMIIIAGKDIINPLVMAFFLSIMLLPLYRGLRKLKLPEMLAISVSLMVLIIILAFIIWFFSSQITRLVSDFPQIKSNIKVHLHSLSSWFGATTGISTEKQTQLLNDQNEKLLNYAGGMLGNTATSLTGILVFMGLLPIYIFLMLFYKNLLLRFVFLWFPQIAHPKVEEVMQATQTIIKSYLVGLLIQITYITILLGGLLFLFGIKHAILIGAIFAVLNLIPYVGALVGNLIGVLLTISSTQEVWPVFAVLGTIAIVQFLDNNILMPRIVGSKVKINALATIVGVIMAGAMAGISGMFLSLPVIAVLKIVCDRTDNLRQWGVLLGDERPVKSPVQWPVFRSKSRAVQKTLEKENDVAAPPDKTAT